MSFVNTRDMPLAGTWERYFASFSTCLSFGDSRTLAHVALALIFLPCQNESSGAPFGQVLHFRFPSHHSFPGVSVAFVCR